MVATADRSHATPSADQGQQREGAAVRDLVRVEFLRLARNPVVMLGAGLSFAFLTSINGDQLPELQQFSSYSALGLAPLVVAAAIACHLNTSLSRRDGSQTLFESLGMTQARRTFAHLVATIGPACWASLVTVAYVGLLATVRSGSGSPDWAELATGVAVVWVGAMLGTAGGIWLPGRGGALLSAAAIAVFQVVLQEFVPGRWHWLALWRAVPDHTSAAVWVRPTGAHLGYLLSIAALVGTVAMWKSSFRASAAIGGVAVMALALSAANQIEPPQPDTVESVLLGVAQNPPFDECQRRGPIDYCVFPQYRRWTRQWDPVVEDVLSVVPRAERARVTLVQRRDAMPRQLIDELGEDTAAGLAAIREAEELRDRRAPGFSEVSPDGDPLYVADVWHRTAENDFALALSVSQRAVGLPTDMNLVKPTVSRGDPMNAELGPDEGGTPPPRVPQRLAQPCHAEGQARAVLALWLAAKDEGRSRVLAGLTQTEDAAFQGDREAGHYRYVQWAHFSVFTTGTDVQTHEAVRWGRADVHVAQQLLAKPEAEVAAAVTGHWKSWVNPNAGTQLLVEYFNLERPPTVPARIRQVGVKSQYRAEIAAAYPDEWHPADSVGGSSPHVAHCED